MPAPALSGGGFAILDRRPGSRDIEDHILGVRCFADVLEEMAAAEAVDGLGCFDTHEPVHDVL